MGREQLKIAFVAQSLHPRGTEKSLVRILNHLDRERYQPELILANARGPYLEDVPADIKPIDLERGDRSTLSGVLRLRRALKELKPDLAIGVHTAPARLLALATYGSGLPFVALEADPFGRNEGAKRAFAIRRWITRKTLKRAAAIVSVSEVVSRDLRRHLGLVDSQITLLPHACFDDSLERLAAEHLDDPWLDKDERPVVVALGNMFPEKDQRTLVAAVGLLGGSARVTIVGEGPERGSLEALARERSVDLHMPGFRENPYPYLRHASVFVSPSVSEGFDIAQVEAMALGVPAVVSSGDRFEVVEHGATGLVVPPGDPQALGEAIQRLIDDPTRAKQLGDRARDAVRFLSAGEVTRRYEKLFDDLARR